MQHAQGFAVTQVQAARKSCGIRLSGEIGDEFRHRRIHLFHLGAGGIGGSVEHQRLRVLGLPFHDQATVPDGCRHGALQVQFLAEHRQARRARLRRVHQRLVRGHQVQIELAVHAQLPDQRVVATTQCLIGGQANVEVAIVEQGAKPDVDRRVRPHLAHQENGRQTDRRLAVLGHFQHGVHAQRIIQT